ncbi:MAG: hypothetical protein O2962_01435 [Cyanobacteria bacterium]|nr:hypothetical protein [Cyanobacteriota bacterium]
MPVLPLEDSFNSSGGGFIERDQSPPKPDQIWDFKGGNGNNPQQPMPGNLALKGLRISA